MTEAQYAALMVKVQQAVDAAEQARQSAVGALIAADAARVAAELAVARVTDAPVRIPYLGTGRLNPK